MTDTLDSKGASELLHVSVQLVLQMARAGEIPAVYIAGHWVFIKADLIDYLTTRARDEQRRRKEAAETTEFVKEAVKRARGRPRKGTGAVC